MSNNAVSDDAECTSRTQYATKGKMETLVLLVNKKMPRRHQRTIVINSTFTMSKENRVLLLSTGSKPTRAATKPNSMVLAPVVIAVGVVVIAFKIVKGIGYTVTPQLVEAPAEHPAGEK